MQSKYLSYFKDYFDSKKEITKVEVFEYCMDFHKFCILDMEDFLKDDNYIMLYDLFMIGEDVLKRDQNVIVFQLELFNQGLYGK